VAQAEACVPLGSGEPAGTTAVWRHKEGQRCEPTRDRPPRLPKPCSSSQPVHRGRSGPTGEDALLRAATPLNPEPSPF